MLVVIVRSNTYSEYFSVEIIGIYTRNTFEKYFIHICCIANNGVGVLVLIRNNVVNSSIGAKGQCVINIKNFLGGTRDRCGMTYILHSNTHLR